MLRRVDHRIPGLGASARSGAVRRRRSRSPKRPWGSPMRWRVKRRPEAAGPRSRHEPSVRPLEQLHDRVGPGGAGGGHPPAGSVHPAWRGGRCRKRWGCGLVSPGGSGGTSSITRANSYNFSLVSREEGAARCGRAPPIGGGGNHRCEGGGPHRFVDRFPPRRAGSPWATMSASSIRSETSAPSPREGGRCAGPRYLRTRRRGGAEKWPWWTPEVSGGGNVSVRVS